MDLLKIFLGARSRGENAVLILETRGKTISTTNTPLSKKGRKNPARVERSQLRLEKFMKKKEDKNQAESSLGNQAAGSPRAGW